MISASKILNSKNIKPAIYSFHTIKPLNTNFLKSVFKKFHTVVTVEEHSIIGGLGSSVSEWMIEKQIKNNKLLKIATPDKFHKLSGSHSFARESLGISSKQIANKILKNYR